MPFFISRNDITTMKTDAIVNAANRELKRGGGVCGAIFKAAGIKEMENACRSLGPIETGDAVATPGFSLPARYVIHTAGPIYSGKKEDRELLSSCYRNSLALAEKLHLTSIAFPLISSGIYGYPADEAEEVAVEAILSFLEAHDMTVYLIILKESERKEMVFSRLAFFLKEGKTKNHFLSRMESLSLKPRDRRFLKKESSIKGGAFESTIAAKYEICPSQGPIPDEFLHPDESFSHALLRMIDEKGLTDPEVYKGANLDRKLFSKIRSNENYRPRKNTILALAVSMKLSVDETEDLLEKAGYTLSRSLTGDLIVLFYLQRGKPDIYEINKALFHFHQPQLGSAL